MQISFSQQGPVFLILNFKQTIKWWNSFLIKISISKQLKFQK